LSPYEYNLGLRFASVAARHRDRVALWWGPGQTISYGELDRLANRTAAALAADGVGAGDVVALAGVKSAATFGAILACLKLGAAYSVFDPASPDERLRRILEVLHPRRILADASSRGPAEAAAGTLGIAVTWTDSESWQEAVATSPDREPPSVRRVTGSAAAYVMFTSGSTGFPKGAVMTHANVLNLIDWSGDTFGITADDVLTNVNPLFFDNSVFDLYSALFHGARLVPFHREEVVDPGALVRKLDQAGCTVWFSVPSLLIFLQVSRAADGRHLRSVTRFVFGGEGFPKAKLKLLFDRYSDSAAFFNVYGPTECTCICSAYEVGSGDFDDLQGLPPLGDMAPNFSYLILDEELHSVPDGEAGELCLLGPNVGRGYFNDPARTATAFQPNPLNTDFEEVMYRTGDLVRLDPSDGKLHILGRRDNQVKHMGHRIELEEIDSALQGIDFLAEGAAFQVEVRGFSRLIAGVAGRRDFTEDEVRQELRRTLPDYMLPSQVVALDRLPRNANGKVDRGALKREFVASTGDTG
jgi:D-alanine--poly(phosphoribitol) ligase subunit 1